MKRLLNIYPSATGIDVALLITRVAVAFLMLVHGLPKMEQLFGDGPIQFPAVLGLSAGISLALAVFAEVVCSILILGGLGTRLAAIPLLITMLVAAFYVHSADPFAQKELAILYMIPYVVLLLMGSGRYSLDYLLLQPSYKRKLSME